MVEQRLGRPVVKAFSNIFAQHLLGVGRPAGTAGRIALPVAEWRATPASPGSFTAPA
jgi:predicted dinucleotide-binding enzyme